MLLAAAFLVQASADPLADLQRALAESSPLEMQATLSRTQALTWESHFAEGTVVVDLARGAFRVDAEVRELRSKETHAVTLLREADRYVFVDHATRTYVEGDQPLLAGLDSRMAYDLARLLPADPAHVADVGAPTLGEPLFLGGVRCTTLLAKTPDGPTAHVWYLSEEDGLPRLWESSRELGGGDTLHKRLTVRAIGKRGEPLPVFSLDELADYARREPSAWTDPETRLRTADAGSFTSLAGGVDALRERFNAEKDHVRAIGLFAPT